MNLELQNKAQEVIDFIRNQKSTGKIGEQECLDNDAIEEIRKLMEILLVTIEYSLDDSAWILRKRAVELGIIKEDSII